jgi:hypothetical protein
MMEDANYFSRLGAEFHIDPLLKDYLALHVKLTLTTLLHLTHWVIKTCPVAVPSAPKLLRRLSWMIFQLSST